MAGITRHAAQNHVDRGPGRRRADLLVRSRARTESLQGRVVAITGASRGLGLAIAREFGRRGARLGICGRDVTTLHRAHADLEGRGFQVLSRACDVRDPVQVEAFVGEVRKRFGGIDVLVNNAGTIEVGPAEVMTAEDFADALATHFWGPYFTVNAALPALAASDCPRIVNIVSVGGLVSVPHLLPYSTSKFALLGYSLGLHAEMALKGIAVTTVCPGLMRTGSPRNARFKGRNQAEYAWFSLMATLPLTAVGAARAARRIVSATVRRERLVVLTLQARLIATAQHLFPSLTLRALALVSALLPLTNGIGTRAAFGYESESPFSSALDFLATPAETDLNQR